MVISGKSLWTKEYEEHEEEYPIYIFISVARYKSHKSALHTAVKMLRLQLCLLLPLVTLLCAGESEEVSAELEPRAVCKLGRLRAQCYEDCLKCPSIATGLHVYPPTCLYCPRLNVVVRPFITTTGMSPIFKSAVRLLCMTLEVFFLCAITLTSECRHHSTHSHPTKKCN
jgi:hypothetical protein